MNFKRFIQTSYSRNKQNSLSGINEEDKEKFDYTISRKMTCREERYSRYL